MNMVSSFSRVSIVRSRDSTVGSGVAAACEALIEAKDFNLAALVAQLPDSEQSRTMMKAQIETWRNRNDWSEMSDQIRTLYTILSGELCIVQGSAGAAENKAPTFNIADRFGLSWQQSLALRFYFGGFSTAREAMASYIEDLNAEDLSCCLFCTASWGMQWCNEHAFGLNGMVISNMDVCNDFLLAWQVLRFLTGKSSCRPSQVVKGRYLTAPPHQSEENFWQDCFL